MYGRPMNGASLCAYLRRKDNKLGSDLNDFKEPIYFHGRKTASTKTMPGANGLYMSNTSTYVETYDLALPNDEMKKNDAIVFCGKGDSKAPILGAGRVWRVETVEVMIEELIMVGGDEEESERRAPKRIMVQ